MENEKIQITDASLSVSPIQAQSNESSIAVGAESGPQSVIANPVVGTPMLQGSADLRQHIWGGLPHRVTLSLFDTSLTIVRQKDGQMLLNLPLSALSNVKKGTDFISFKANGKRWQLEFALLGEKEKNYLLGGAGGTLYSIAKHSGDAKEWKEALIAKGVQVGRAWT